MKYSAPELVVIGRADVVVMGRPGATIDNVGTGDTQPLMGFALGLDD